MIVLLAPSDEGRSDFHKDHAAALAALGAPPSPAAFPDLMATAITQCDLAAFVDRNDLSALGGAE